MLRLCFSVLACKCVQTGGDEEHYLVRMISLLTQSLYLAYFFLWIKKKKCRSEQ